MEVIGKGGGEMGIICGNFFTINMLLFHMLSVDIDTAWRRTPSSPSGIIKTE